MVSLCMDRSGRRPDGSEKANQTPSPNMLAVLGSSTEYRVITTSNYVHTDKNGGGWPLAVLHMIHMYGYI